MKKYLDKILIITGIFLIIVAVFIKSNVEKKQNDLVNAYEDYISNIKNNKNEAHDSLKFDSIKKEELQESNKKLKNLNNISVDMKNIIGILSIPKIDLNVTIAEGIENETLKYSVGHFEETAMPGEIGNCSLVGHRSYTYGEYFNRLGEVEIGDTLIVKTDTDVYTYKVNEIKVVEPEEVSVLDQHDKREITLVTCTPIRIATHRLIVKGELIKSE